MAFVEKLLKNEIQTSYWYLYEYIGILMMLPFLGAIARNVDLDCMKYFLGLGPVSYTHLVAVNFTIAFGVSYGITVILRKGKVGKLMIGESNDLKFA